MKIVPLIAFLLAAQRLVVVASGSASSSTVQLATDSPRQGNSLYVQTSDMRSVSQIPMPSTVPSQAAIAAAGVTRAQYARQKAAMDLKYAGRYLAEGAIAAPVTIVASAAAMPFSTAGHTLRDLRRGDVALATCDLIDGILRPVKAPLAGLGYSAMCLFKGTYYLCSAAKAICTLPQRPEARQATMYYDENYGRQRSYTWRLRDDKEDRGYDWIAHRESRRDFGKAFVGFDVPAYANKAKKMIESTPMALRHIPNRLREQRDGRRMKAQIRPVHSDGR